MAQYVNDAMLKQISEKSLNESITESTPVPSNVRQSFVLDDFLKELLEESHKEKELSWDGIIQKIQLKVINVFGPLTNIWASLDEIKDPNGQMEMLVSDLEVVTMVGQAVQSMAYHRRHNILTAITGNPRKVSKTLKDKAELLQSEKSALFGKKFEEKLVQTIKSKQKSSELLKSLRSKPKSPFRKVPRF